MTSWEILTHCDTHTGSELEINDQTLSQMQVNTRNQTQTSSAVHKACGGKLAEVADISVGSLVFIKDDCSKNRARERYIVVDIQGSECYVKKLLKSSIRDQKYRLKLRRYSLLILTSFIMNNTLEVGTVVQMMRMRVKKLWWCVRKMIQDMVFL